MDQFNLQTRFEPAGDQPVAIAQLVEGLEAGLSHQTLLGVTGSGKTFTIANVIQNVCMTAHARACSRPPLPRMRMFIKALPLHLWLRAF